MLNNAHKRHHLGAGVLTFRREVSVFINCPYDAGFAPLFDAIVFATICCGFLPRCAIESGTTSLPRMTRIAKAMEGSKYSIHDLSRCQGEGDTNLARFNMPLELGMAMSQRGQTKKSSVHDWFVLVPCGHPYKRYISDLAGYDPTEYDGTYATVVPAVMSWLATRPDAVETPTPQSVLNAIPAFRTAREGLCAAWCGQEPWTDVLLKAISIATEASLIPSVTQQPVDRHANPQQTFRPRSAG
jgi:hypothetical protein